MNLDGIPKTTEEIKRKVQEYNEKNNRKGVCYLSRIPPYMNVANIRKMLSPYGIERIFLQSEDDSRRKHRIKAGGNRRKCYTEGWVEFTDKKVAKNVALSLNCTKMISKKRGFYSEDLWNIQYLAQFKWDNLTEKLAYDQRIRKEKIKAELAQEKKKQEFYLEKLDLSKKILAMENKKKEKMEEADLPVKKKGMVRKFKQHEAAERKLTGRKKIKKLQKFKIKKD